MARRRKQSIAGLTGVYHFLSKYANLMRLEILCFFH